MGYAVDISNKLAEMKNKELNHEFQMITERLIETNSEDMLEPLYRIICQYDKTIRKCVGLEKTNENLNSKLYGRKNNYSGGYYKRRDNG